MAQEGLTDCGSSSRLVRHGSDFLLAAGLRHAMALLARFAACPQTPVVGRLTSTDGQSLLQEHSAIDGQPSRRRETPAFSRWRLDSVAADTAERPLSVSDDPG